MQGCSTIVSATVSTRGNVLRYLARLMGVGLFLSAVAAPAFAQGGIYTCLDRHGRRLTADRPISECQDREQQELTSSGTVKRNIGPSLSDQERMAIEDRKRKEIEEREKQREKDQRNQVLLVRYPTKATHDAERAQAVAGLNDVQSIAQKRIAELKKERYEVDTALTAYKNNPSAAPFQLRRRSTEIVEDIKIQERFVAKQVQQRNIINDRFDVELLLLNGLWRDAQANAPQP